MHYLGCQFRTCLYDWWLHIVKIFNHCYDIPILSPHGSTRPVVIILPPKPCLVDLCCAITTAWYGMQHVYSFVQLAYATHNLPLWSINMWPSKASSPTCGLTIPRYWPRSLRDEKNRMIHAHRKQADALPEERQQQRKLQVVEFWYDLNVCLDLAIIFLDSSIFLCLTEMLSADISVLSWNQEMDDLEAINKEIANDMVEEKASVDDAAEEVPHRINVDAVVPGFLMVSGCGGVFVETQGTNRPGFLKMTLQGGYVSSRNEVKYVSSDNQLKRPPNWLLFWLWSWARNMSKLIPPPCLL